MASYGNPNHPLGTLHPQPEGAFGGGGRTQAERQRDAQASLSTVERDPTFNSVWQAHRLGIVEAMRRGVR